MFGNGTQRELGEIKTKLEQVHEDLGSLTGRVRNNERLLWQFMGAVVLAGAVLPITLASGALNRGEPVMERVNTDARVEPSEGEL